MTPGFSRLSVSGYRRLKALDVELRPLNVLIGANGVGKSSILDAFRLLAAAANGSLATAISDMGAFPFLLTADGTTGTLVLGVQTHQDAAPPLRYEVRLSAAGFSYSISREFLTPRLGGRSPASPMPIDADGSHVRYLLDGQHVEPDWEYKWSETALSQTPKTNRDAERFRHVLTGISQVYHRLDVARNAPVRTPQTLAPAQTPGLNGEDLVSCLYTIRETASDRFDAIEAALRAAFPDFERLDFPPVTAGRIALT